ncbi:MAG: hypothetical protein J6R38_05455 [Alistipes sp.]|nr:hypothetical protein [Alistipes sp.]
MQHLQPSNNKLWCATQKGVVCDLSINASNETFAKYYPSVAFSCQCRI